MSFWVRLFKKDILRKIVALFFAILLYWTMSSKNGAEERFDNVLLNIDYPDGIVNVENKENYVSLYCVGSKRMLDTLRATGIKGNIKVSIKNYVEGVPYSLKLTEDDFQLPLGVKIERIVPNVLVLNLEPRISKTVKVEPNFDVNKLQEDYLVKNVEITPHEVHIVGPASAVNGINSVKTEEIPLDRSITDNFDYVSNLALPASLSATPRSVSCHLTIDKEYTEKEMNEVYLSWQCRAGGVAGRYVLQKPTVNITLYGSRSELEKVGYDKINAYVDVSNLKEKGTYDLEVKCFIESDGKVTIRDISPKFIKVTVK